MCNEVFSYHFIYQEVSETSDSEDIRVYRNEHQPKYLLHRPPECGTLDKQDSVD
jgi:hypothetical protein